MVDAREYHERSKLSIDDLRAAAEDSEGESDDDSGGGPDPATRPRPYKEYVDAPTVDLGTVRAPAMPALSAVAHARADPLAGTAQSPPAGMDRETVGTLCYESAGITQVAEGRDGGTTTFRAASCTGKLYHVECYLACGGVADLADGLYHFDPRRFALDRLREGDHRDVLAGAVGDPATGAADAGGGGPAGDGDTGPADAGDVGPAGDADGAEGPGDGTGSPTGTGVAEAPATVVLTSQWWRNAWGYGDRTYRHAFWDAGTVAANLLATAHALDYRAELVTAFADDRVAALLGVDPTDEAPLALVPVGSGAPVPVTAAGDGAAGADPPPVDAGAVPPGPAGRGGDGDGDDDGGRDREYPLVHEAWAASTLPDGAAAADYRRACRAAGPVGTTGAESGSGTGSNSGAGSNSGVGSGSGAGTGSGSGTGPSDGDRVPLDPVDSETASARPLHATVQRRGSCRTYAGAGPTRRQVGTVLDRAIRGVPADYDGDDGVGLAYNDVHVLATGVDGLDDGRYRYRPATADLRRLGDTDAATKQYVALDQSWAGAAHVNVYFLADVEAVVGTHGNRGYRLAQLEAGVTLGRLYLATYAHRELGGTGLTFSDDDVTEHCSPGADGRTPTCLFAFGRRGD